MNEASAEFEGVTAEQQGVAVWVWAIIGASVAAVAAVLVVGGIWYAKRQQQQQAENMFEIVVPGENVCAEPQQSRMTPIVFESASQQ